MGLFTEQDEYDDFKVKPKKMNKEKIMRVITVVGIVIILTLGLYFLITMPPEQRNYEVRGADGTVYHTTSIAHGTQRIWFTDENGNRVELGGGYTVIQK